MGRPKGSKNGERQLIDRTCETCKAIFQVEPYRAKARFCSRACQSIGHSKELLRQKDRKCAYCGVPFAARPASKQKYCSTACASKEHGYKVTGHRTAYWECVCPICDKTFTARATLQQVFCSRECASKSLERHIELVCEVCHKVYTVRRKFFDQKYCSRKCRTIGIGKTESYLERKMSAGLSSRGIDTIPQYAIGPYVVDFAIPDHHIVIECDGDYWHSLPTCAARDRRKDKYLTGKGWRVLRFSETYINARLTACLNQVAHAMSL